MAEWTDEDRYHADMFAEEMADVAECKRLLSRLDVASLRVLARKYFHMDKREANTMRKPELVDELAVECGHLILGDMHRNWRKP